MDEKTALTYAIARGLAYTENRGKPDIQNPKAGKTGEMKSIYQFTPDTWKKLAQQYLGDANALINPDNETKVATSRISDWIDKGYNVKQMASMWNAGEGEPYAYTGKFSTGKSSVGTNKKYGVGYNVPQYADSVANYAKKFYTDEFSKQITPSVQNSQAQPIVSQNPPPTGQTLNPGLLSNLKSPTT
jgi:hypothetical protein